MNTDQVFLVPCTMQSVSCHALTYQFTTSVYTIFVSRSLIDEDLVTDEVLSGTLFEFYYIRIDYVNGRANAPGEYTRVRLTLEGNQLENTTIDTYANAIRYIENGVEGIFNENNIEYTTDNCTWDMTMFQPFFTGVAYTMDLNYDCTYMQEDLILIYSGWNFNDNLIAHPNDLRADLQVQSTCLNKYA